MSVKRARNGNGYEARWRENGVNRSATFRTKKDAQAAERLGRDRERGRRNGLPFEQGPILYDELCERVVAQHQAGARTIRTLEERLAYSRRAFGPVRVRELRPESISRWYSGLAVGLTTRGNALRAMRQILELGVKWGYLPSNPAGPKAVQIRSGPPKEVKPFESWQDVYAVAAAAGPYGPLIVFVCATGLRPQEWMAVEWRDLDWSARTLRVLRTVVEGAVEPTAKTDGSLRTIVLQQRAIDALDSLPRPLDRTQRIFSAPNGGLINLSNWRRRIWKPALAATGLEHRPPSEMRHTFATLGLSAGVPIEWISRHMGHRNIQTTLRHYARFLPAADARVIVLLDEYESEACVQIAYTRSVTASDKA